MNVKPTMRQLEYQKWEFGLFIHFGLRTFYEDYTDFDQRPMTPAVYHPIQFDAEQWIRHAKDAGMEYAVFTAKHHDGFSNWPSIHTDFSVANSPWKSGKGDAVREFVDACRKYDMRPGLYYSPYDGSQESWALMGKAYDDYFIAQITELLGNYGEIDILWFDGCGSENHEFDWVRIIKAIRSLQPNLLIFNLADPDFRWIGNEDGIAPLSTRNVTNKVDISILSDEGEGLGTTTWLPAECDVQLRDSWFYSSKNENSIKSVEELMGLYYYSIGRGTNLLLNIAPDKQGLLPQKDVDRLGEFSAEVRRRFSRPLLTIDSFQKKEEKWMYLSEAPFMVDHAIIQENLCEGEHAERYRITVRTVRSHTDVTIYEGRNIGHKAIVRFPPVSAVGVILEILESTGPTELKELSFFYSENA